MSNIKSDQNIIPNINWFFIFLFFFFNNLLLQKYTRITQEYEVHFS